MNLRLATPADAAAIARVHVRAWRAGYRGIVAEKVLADLSEAERESLWNEILSRGGEDFTLVAEAPDATVVGFCSGRAQTREIAALYVDPGHWRRGIGGRLLDAALERLGGPDVALWVLEANAPARAFYATRGFAPDGARATHECSHEDEIRLLRT